MTDRAEWKESRSSVTFSTPTSHVRRVSFILKQQILTFVSNSGKQPRKNKKYLKLLVGMKTVFSANVWTFRNIWEVFFFGGGEPWTLSEGVGDRQQLKILQQLQISLYIDRTGGLITFKFNGDWPGPLWRFWKMELFTESVSQSNGWGHSAQLFLANRGVEKTTRLVRLP
jgi:hypothetical protein